MQDSREAGEAGKQGAGLRPYGPYYQITALRALLPDSGPTGLYYQIPALRASITRLRPYGPYYQIMALRALLTSILALRALLTSILALRALLPDTGPTGIITRYWPYGPY